MAATLKDTILGRVRRHKKSLRQVPDFANNRDARCVMVVLLTLEGSLVFGDIEELGDLCVQFCRKKEIEATEAN